MNTVLDGPEADRYHADASCGRGRFVGIMGMGDTVVTEIRPERPDDCAAIHEVNRLAFGGEDEARLIDEIRRGPDFDPALSLVAVRGQTVVGHILFSPIQIESPQRTIPALALAPMAVLPDCQRQGVGTKLVGEGLEVCRRLGHGLVVVVGHPEYYPRFGFVKAAGYGLKAPFEVPEDSFMVLVLGRPEGLDALRGVVRYPRAFGQA